MRLVPGLAAAALLTLLAGVPARAQRLSVSDGHTMLAFCASKNTVGCDAYLFGVVDSAGAAPAEQRPFCVPETDITDQHFAPQLRTIMMGYLTTHPKELLEKVGVLSRRALIGAFPCTPAKR